MRRLVTISALFILAGLLVGGCGKSEKTVYKDKEGKVTVTKKSRSGDAHTVNVETKEGKASVTAGENKTITEAELGAPVYPGARVQVSGQYQGNSADDENVQQHILSTKDDFDKVVEFYKTHLKDIKDQQTMSSGDTKMAIFTVGKDKNQLVVHLSWDAKEKQTMIQVMKKGM